MPTLTSKAIEIAQHMTYAPATLSEPRRVDPLAVAILRTPILGITLFGKLAIPVGESEVLLGVPLIIASTIVGIASKRLVPDRTRFPFYLAMIGVVTAQQVFTVEAFSLPSLILLALLHSAYAFRLVGAGDDPEPHMRWFLNLAFFICIAGIVQYFAQFVVGPRYAFPLEHFAPRWILANQYNMMNPLRYASPVFKSNGVFLAEPSYFSQMLAAAFVCEVLTARRLWRLACFCGGFLVAYSGTGLLMLAAAIPVYIVVHRRYDLVIFLAGAALLLLLLKDVPGISVFVERMDEFSDPRSSAYMRYVGGLHLLDQHLLSDPQRWLFGFGSGMMFRSTPAAMLNVAETGWVKIILEYGLLGSGIYFAFLYSCVGKARQPLAQRVALGATTLLSGILDPGAHGVILSLLIWLPAQRPDASSSPSMRGRR